MESLQKRFEKFCEEQFKNSQTSGSKTITKEKGKRIIHLLKKDDESEEYSPKFKHWVKQRGFQLVTYSALGLQDVLCLPAKTEVSLSYLRLTS